jgi:hypothetical protein
MRGRRTPMDAQVGPDAFAGNRSGRRLQLAAVALLSGCALLFGSGCNSGPSIAVDAGPRSCPAEDPSDPLVCYAPPPDGGSGCALADLSCCDGGWFCPNGTELIRTSQLPADDGGGCANLNFGYCP